MQTKAGANVNAQNVYGVTPLSLANAYATLVNHGGADPLVPVESSAVLATGHTVTAR